MDLALGIIIGLLISLILIALHGILKKTPIEFITDSTKEVTTSITGPPKGHIIERQVPSDEIIKLLKEDT